MGPIDVEKVMAYVTLHFFEVRSAICDIEATWKKGDYKGAGKAAMKEV